jgi:hypothetical protein
MKVAVVALVLAVLTVAAATAAVAHGGSTVARQRISIVNIGENGFGLAPLGPGPLKQDLGSATFCCWTDHNSVRDGQSIDISTGPTMTLKGKLGTLVAMNRMEWLDTTGNVSIFTGTWKITKGTGAYKGLTGGGGVAGVMFANGNSRWQRQGLVYLK